MKPRPDDENELPLGPLGGEDSLRHPWPAEGPVDPPVVSPPPPPEEAVTPAPPPDDPPFRALMDRNFLSYASYVIRDRAIPAIEDGLKPVQRRILHTLHQNDDGKFIKVANIVGDCMKYHPHGDASIGDALVVLTQKRYLIEGQGNFGNIYTGDPAAAARYIECRLTELARAEVFNDKLATFIPSYDGRNQEPVTLPTKLPLLLMLGAEGIAVGLSTRLFSHNFGELIEAQIAILQNKPFEILPDFPQGGLMDASGYDKGRGKVKLRALIEPKEHLAGTLVIRELPAGTTTESLIGSIEEAARKKKIRIKSLDDFTAETVEIEIKLMPGEDPQKVIKALYLFTECEQSVSARPIVIRGDRPVEMDVDEILRANTAQLVATLKAELELRQTELVDGIHQRSLAQIFIEHRIYKKIEECETYEAVQGAVLRGVNRYREQLRRDVTPEDVETLLGLRIKRISLFDMTQNQRDIDKLVAELAETETHLRGLTRYAIAYLKNLHKTYARQYPRLTRIGAFEEANAREHIARNLAIAYDPVRGYLGYGVKGEGIEPGFRCSELDRILTVTTDGRYKVIAPPEKLFVDRDLLLFAIFDREQIYHLVYGTPWSTHLKRFQFGGTILGKEYQCAPPKSKILLLTAEALEKLYLKYKPFKATRGAPKAARAGRDQPDEQIVDLAGVALQSPKNLGAVLSYRAVDWLKTSRPRGWNEDGETPLGPLFPSS